MQQCLDARNKPLNVGDFVACTNSKPEKRLSKAKFYKIERIEQILDSFIPNQIIYAVYFENSKMSRRADDVLKLEQ